MVPFVSGFIREGWRSPSSLRQNHPRVQVRVLGPGQEPQRCRAQFFVLALTERGRVDADAITRNIEHVPVRVEQEFAVNNPFGVRVARMPLGDRSW